jgi:hypothetical protein
MIELTLKSTLIFGLAAGTNALLRRTSAAQHAIWMLAFVSMPLLFLLPYLPAPVVHAMPIPIVSSGTGLGAVVMAPRSIDYVKPLWVTGTLVLCLRLVLSFVWLHYRRDMVTTPLTIGPLRPKIHLPRSAAQWPIALRKSVMLHEQAHIRRRDTLSQLFSQIVCAVIWFQPLAWYAARRAAEERERACDDLVLASGVDAVLYAGHVIDIARESAQIPAVVMGTARASSLEKRLRAKESRSRQRRPIPTTEPMLQCLSGDCIFAHATPGRTRKP